MKPWATWMVSVAALCCLPVVMLAPVLIADDPCPNQSATNDVCSWAGCNLMIYTCAGCDPLNCYYGECAYTGIQVNKFKCVSNSGYQCAPVQDGHGTALSTNCVLWWWCYSDEQGDCLPTDIGAGSCLAPYYQSVQCS